MRQENKRNYLINSRAAGGEASLSRLTDDGDGETLAVGEIATRQPVSELSWVSGDRTIGRYPGLCKALARSLRCAHNKIRARDMDEEISISPMWPLLAMRSVLSSTAALSTEWFSAKARSRDWRTSFWNSCSAAFSTTGSEVWEAFMGTEKVDSSSLEEESLSSADSEPWSETSRSQQSSAV